MTWTSLTAITQTETTEIHRIVLTGNQILTDNEIRDVMQTRVGQTFDPIQLKQDFDQIINRFHAQGYHFAQIDEGRLLIKQFDRGLYLHIHIDEGTIG